MVNNERYFEQAKRPETSTSVVLPSVIEIPKKAIFGKTISYFHEQEYSMCNRSAYM